MGRAMATDIEPVFVLTGSLNESEEDCRHPDKAFVLTFNYAQVDVNNDCRGSEGAFNLELPEGSAFLQIHDAHIAELPLGFRLAFSPFAPAGPSVLSPAAWERWQSFASPQLLVESVDFALAEQALIHPYGAVPKPTTTQPETLTAWLHITNACNLDCPYCYVRKSSARMNETTGRQAIESVFWSAQKNGFRRVKLKYAGGEATLHFSLVRRLHAHACKLAAEMGLGLNEVVLSNGVHIRPEDADWLVAEGIKLMISVDGVSELHDQLRFQKNGEGSFDRVAHTMDQVLLPRGLRPDVTMTVTRLNASGVADVARWALIERGLPTSFNLYRQNILSASRTDLALEETSIIDGMLAAYAVIEAQLPLQPFFNGLLDRVQAEAHSHTCGVGQSYVVITHTGKLAQCQMHLDSPVSSVLPDDLLPLVADGPLRNMSVDDKYGCRDCEFRYRCSGGCPLETFRATGRWDVQSPNCHIYKTLLPAALRLEGLRLLKAHGYVS